MEYFFFPGCNQWQRKTAEALTRGEARSAADRLCAAIPGLSKEAADKIASCKTLSPRLKHSSKFEALLVPSVQALWLPPPKGLGPKAAHGALLSCPSMLGSGSAQQVQYFVETLFFGDYVCVLSAANLAT